MQYWQENYVDPEVEDLDDTMAANLEESQLHSIVDDYESDYEMQHEFMESSSSSSNLSKKAARKKKLMDAATAYLAGPVTDPLHRRSNPEAIKVVDALETRLACPDVADWWREQEKNETLFKPLAKMARDIFSVIPHGVGVEHSFSIARMVVSWQQHRMSAETLKQRMIVRQDSIRRDESDPYNAAKAENDRIMKQAELHDHAWTKYQSFERNTRRVRKEYNAKARAGANVRSRKHNKGKGFISDEESESEEDLDPDIEILDVWEAFDDDGESSFRSTNGKPPAFESIALLYPEKQRDLATAAPTYFPPAQRFDRVPGESDNETEDEDTSYLDAIGHEDEVETYDELDWQPLAALDEETPDDDDQSLQDRIDAVLYKDSDHFDGDISDSGRNFNKLQRKLHTSLIVAPPVPGSAPRRSLRRIEALSIKNAHQALEFQARPRSESCAPGSARGAKSRKTK